MVIVLFQIHKYDVTVQLVVEHLYLPSLRSVAVTAVFYLTHFCPWDTLISHTAALQRLQMNENVGVLQRHEVDSPETSQSLLPQSSLGSVRAHGLAHVMGCCKMTYFSQFTKGICDSCAIKRRLPKQMISTEIGGRGNLLPTMLALLHHCKCCCWNALEEWQKSVSKLRRLLTSHVQPTLFYCGNISQNGKSKNSPFVCPVNMNKVTVKMNYETLHL